MREKTRDALSLFTEKSEKLLSLSFTKSVLAGETGVRVSGGTGKETEVERRGPSEEAIDAFILTFRFFIQDNESTSFRSLHDTVLDDPGLSDGWKQEFLRVRTELNHYLDGPLGMNLIWNGKPVSCRREVLDVFVYGGLAHANARKRKIFEKWKSNPVFFALLQFELVNTLFEALRAIAYISRLCKQELEGEVISIVHEHAE